MKHFVCALFILCFCLQSKAQDVIVRGGFFSDSVAIGEQTRYYLAAKYPSKLNVIFPDSTYDFKPFEFEKKQYFPTETTDSISYDSVVYFLSTFEIDSVQFLGVPVFVIDKADTTTFTATVDNILLSELVQQVPDSLPIDKLPLKMNTAYQKVSYLFNYPVVIIVIAVLLVGALIVILVFGKRIRKHFKIKRLKRNHQQFIEKYVLHIAEVKQQYSTVATESTLATWKKYMEQLEGWPYTKLTTRETTLLAKDQNLTNHLHAIDKAIYGHEKAVVQPLEQLHDYANKKFIKKLEEVKHGK